MTKKYLFKQLLITLLCFAMSISLMCQPAYALENNTSTTVNTTAENFEKEYVNVFDNQYGSLNEENINYEDNSLREEYVKHFVMNDGTTQAVVYETQVHEQDEKGLYQEIDNTLSANNNKEYENTKNNKWKVKFSKEAKKTLVHIHEDNMNIKWGIANFNESKASFLVDDEPYTKLSNKAVSAVVVYENILDNIDVQYQLSHQKVKENVILKSKEAQHIIYYDLDTNGYDISVVDNQIVLSKDNKEDYIIEVPYMMDNNGVFHDGITLSYENNQVKMELDSEWLLAEDRAYPVIVDPTIKKKLTNSSVDNTSVNKANPNSTAMYQYGALYVGREASSYGSLRGAFKFALPTIDESNMVIAASITLSQLNFYGSGTNYIRVNPITANLPLSSLTWNKLNGKIGDVIDYALTTSSTKGKWFSFDITKTVREWYTTGKNYGLALVSANESGSYRYTTFVTTRNTGLESRFPYASVTYISQDGLESYLTYQTMSTVSMGSFNVGDFNGNLIYTYNDFSMSGNHMPVGISHVFNHHQRAKEDTVSSSMKFGKGMRLNVSMKIEYNSSNDYYTLTDEDGTVHYFYKDSTSGKYLKEYDTEVKITVNTNDYTIDNASQRILFNKTTGLITEVQDKVSNKKQVYTYNTNNQLVTITDGANRNTTFTYNENNYLTSITYADNRTISYTYSNNQLSTITQPDGNVINFTYNGDLLESVSNPNEGKVQAEYLTVSPRRVSKLTRYGTNNTEGDSLSFTYNTGDTVVTDEDGYALTYMFDLSGHTVCVKDSEGNALYGQYENSNDNNKHSLSFESKLQTSTVNLAVNHSPTSTSNWTSSTTLSVVDTSDTKAEFSGKAFKLTNTNNISQAINYAVSQNESYTISAYVKINSLTPTDSTQDYGVYVGIQDTEIHRSNLYKDLNEWKRISYTYTADSNITNNNWSIQIGTTNVTGEVLVKNIQLEKGTVANRYNFIENGHFVGTVNSASVSNWTKYENISTSEDKVVSSGYDGNGYYLLGYMDVNKYLYQNVSVSGKEGDAFVLSGWGKHNGVVLKGLNGSLSTANAYDRSIKLALVFYKTDGSVGETRDVSLTSMSNSWQYASGSMMAPHDYSKVQVRLYFSYQKGAITYDNIQLYMESFGTSYEHDDKGRVIASQDIDGNIVKTEYMDITITEEDGTETITDVVEYVEYKRKDDTEYLKKTTYTYNTRGKVDTETYTDFNVPETDPSRTVETVYEYDEDFNLVSTSINGQKKYESGKIDYSENYISSFTDERGKVTNYQFNQTTGNIEKVTDANNTETNYTYKDKTSQIESVTTNTSKVNYSYTALGLVENISHNTTNTNDDVVYTFSYDEFGNVETIKVGNRTLATYEYGIKNGTLNSTTYGTNEKISYSYDSLERVTGIYENDVLKYSWEYGNDGRIGRFIDHNDNGSIKYSYDLSGNVTEEERSDGTYLFNTYKQDSSMLLTTGYQKDNNSSTTSVTYNPREEVETVTWNTSNSLSSISYTRDFLRRIQSSSYQVNNNTILNTTYNYLELDESKQNEGDDVTTNVLSYVQNTYNNTTDTYSYEFDNVGNIASITKKVNETTSYTNTYEYDSLNQLIRENNQELQKTYTFNYDNGGNLLEAKTYNYTTVTISGTPLTTETYDYNDSSWKDLLTSYNGNPITYDNIGNPLTYHDGKQFTWSFRRLEQIVDGSNTYTYTYNQDGIRTSKTVNGVTTNYIVSGNRILEETTSTNTIIYEYDALGNASSFVYNGTRYIYLRNGTNDIVGILNSSGTLVTTYKYDGWGNVEVINHTIDTIGTINPIRYRSYYYDVETGYYYLNSRYYDSNVGRFISEDVYASTGQGILGHNMFAYCQNNPILFVDSTGTRIVMADLGVAISTSKPKIETASVSATNISKFNSKFMEDVKNVDLFNSDEQKVIDANYFSFYKGRLVIWNSLFDRSASFGMILMSNDDRENGKPIDYSKALIKHEYGHTIQLNQLGVMDYIFCIFIPSADKWGDEPYYYKPWELSASKYGGADYLLIGASDEQINNAENYMKISRLFGPYSWFAIM